MADIYNLERFKQAQDLGVYDKALKEVQNGRKNRTLDLVYLPPDERIR